MNSQLSYFEKGSQGKLHELYNKLIDLEGGLGYVQRGMNPVVSCFTNCQQVFFEMKELFLEADCIELYELAERMVKCMTMCLSNAALMYEELKNSGGSGNPRDSEVSVQSQSNPSNSKFRPSSPEQSPNLKQKQIAPSLSIVPQQNNGNSEATIKSFKQMGILNHPAQHRRPLGGARLLEISNQNIKSVIQSPQSNTKILIYSQEPCTMRGASQPDYFAEQPEIGIYKQLKEYFNSQQSTLNRMLDFGLDKKLEKLIMYFQECQAGVFKFLEQNPPQPDETQTQLDELIRICDQKDENMRTRMVNKMLGIMEKTKARQNNSGKSEKLEESHGNYDDGFKFFEQKFKQSTQNSVGVQTDAEKAVQGTRQSILTSDISKQNDFVSQGLLMRIADLENSQSDRVAKYLEYIRSEIEGRMAEWLALANISDPRIHQELSDKFNSTFDVVAMQVQAQEEQSCKVREPSNKESKKRSHHKASTKNDESIQSQEEADENQEPVMVKPHKTKPRKFRDTLNPRKQSSTKTQQSNYKHFKSANGLISQQVEFQNMDSERKTTTSRVSNFASSSPTGTSYYFGRMPFKSRIEKDDQVINSTAGAIKRQSVTRASERMSKTNNNLSELQRQRELVQQPSPNAGQAPKQAKILKRSVVRKLDEKPQKKVMKMTVKSIQRISVLPYVP